MESLNTHNGPSQRTATISVNNTQLISIYHTPCQVNSSRSAVIILPGGPQYRVGAHRIFIQLSRFISLHNIAVLRFDKSGHGDSGGDIRTFGDYHHELSCAVEHLLQIDPTIQHITLWGLCDGATFAGLASGIHPKINRLILCNPWLQSEQAAALTQIKHYYPSRLQIKTVTRLLRQPSRLAGIVIDFIRQIIISRQHADSTPPLTDEFFGSSSF